MNNFKGLNTLRKEFKITDLFELTALAINAYLCTTKQLSLCGFNESDSFSKTHIVDLKPHFRQWISENGTVVAFRYLLSEATKTDVLYVKILKLSNNHLQ